MRYQDTVSVCLRAERSYVGLFLPLFRLEESFFRSVVAGLNLLHVGKGKGVQLLLGMTMDERRCRYLGPGRNFWLV